MTGSNWTVEGRTFRTQHDYLAGCRDKKKIDQIRNKINFQNKDAMIKLQTALKKGSIKFDTMVGSDFCDEVDEIVSKLKKLPEKKKKLFQKKGVKNNNQKTGSIKEVKPEELLNNLDDSLKQEVIQEFKKREQYRKLLIFALALVAVCSLGYFTYYYYVSDKNGVETTDIMDLKGDSRFNDKLIVDENNQVEKKEVINKYKTLYQLNKNLIGWIKIADTDIDYPIMQTDNDTFYLNHNFDHEKDKNGCIFMDPKCNAMAPSTNLIIYGHNMRSGKMFGTLSQYEDESYYEQHKKIQFDTIYQEGTYEVIYAFRSQLYKETDIVFKYYQFIDPVSVEEFNSNMNEMQKMSLYDTGVTAEYGDQLVTLSTCDYNEKNGRFVVVAKRVE